MEVFLQEHFYKSTAENNQVTISWPTRRTE